MKVAIEFFPRVEVSGGAGVKASHVAKHLAKEREAAVLTTRERGAKKEDEFLGIKVLRLGEKRKYSLAGAFGRLSFILEGVRVKKWGLSQKQRIPAVATIHEVWIGKWIDNVGVARIFGELLERCSSSRDLKKFLAMGNFIRGLVLVHEKLRKKVQKYRWTLIAEKVHESCKGGKDF